VATKLFVGNLSFSTTNADLEALFGQVGAVTSANVIMDKITGRSRGFGFVEMANAPDIARRRSSALMAQTCKAVP
jgi:cold-inducible RNA-binding protein